MAYPERQSPIFHQSFISNSMVQKLWKLVYWKITTWLPKCRLPHSKIPIGSEIMDLAKSPFSAKNRVIFCCLASNEILGTWFEPFPIVVGQPNLVSSFLKQFSGGVLKKKLAPPLYKLTFPLPPLSLGTWFEQFSIVVGQPNLVSSFLKQFFRGVFFRPCKISK